MDGGDMMGGGGQWRKRPFPDDDDYGYGSYPAVDPMYRGMEPPPPNYRRQDPYQNYNQSYTGGYRNQSDSSNNQGQMDNGQKGGGSNSWSSFFDESGSFNPEGSAKPAPQQKPKPPNQGYGQSQGYGQDYGSQGMYSTSYDFSQDVPIDKDSNQQLWGRGGGSGQKKRGGRVGRGGGGGGRGGQSNKPWGSGPAPWNQSSAWEDNSEWSDMVYNAYYSGNQSRNYNKRGQGRGHTGLQTGRGGRGSGSVGTGGRGRGGDRGRGQGRGAQRGGRGKGNQGLQQNKPGMPPNQIGGVKKRGGIKQTSVPPVHSMATCIKLDVSQMSTAEKIRRFCLFLQSETAKVNAIQTIENGITGSKLGLKTEYKCEELMKVANKWMYTGSLTLSGVFLARSVGGNKKEVKHDTYSKALEILKTKTVAEIYTNVDPGPDAIRNELSSSLDKDMDISNQATKALEKQEQIASTMASNEEGFCKLIHYLKTYEKLPDSKVGAIEQAVVASKCNMDHKYEDGQVRLPTGKMIFRGNLTFEGVVIGRAVGHKRKETKTATYTAAYENLTEKSLQDVLKGVPEDDDPIKGDKAVFGSDIDAKKNMTLPEKIDALMAIVKDTQFRDNNVNTIDCSAIHLGLIPTCIYRKSIEEGGPNRITCELFIDNILIGTGESEKRKDAQVEAYNSAYDTLCTSASDYIIKEHKRLKTEDTNDPNIIDVWVKGEGKHNVDSNRAGLRRYKFDPDDGSKTVDHFVILEHDDWAMDRKRQAFCILNYSATMNGMLVQWDVQPDGFIFKCDIKLQGQQIGEAFGPSKVTARNMAAADALFRLYESQSVIKILRRDDSKLWIAYDNIATKADAVRQASGEEDKQEPIEETKEGEAPPLPSPNKWVMKILEEILNTFDTNHTLDELIFGPGMPVPEKKALSEMARKLELKVNTRQREGQGYTVIHKIMHPKEMVDCLLKNQGSSGKYNLIPVANLPKHADIEEELRRTNPATNPNAAMVPASPFKKKTSHFKGQKAQDMMMKIAEMDKSVSMETQGYENPKINWLN